MQHWTPAMFYTHCCRLAICPPWRNGRPYLNFSFGQIVRVNKSVSVCTKFSACTFILCITLAPDESSRVSVVLPTCCEAWLNISQGYTFSTMPRILPWRRCRDVAWAGPFQSTIPGSSPLQMSRRSPIPPREVTPLIRDILWHQNKIADHHRWDQGSSRSSHLLLAWGYPSSAGNHRAYLSWTSRSVALWSCPYDCLSRGTSLRM